MPQAQPNLMAPWECMSSLSGTPPPLKDGIRGQPGPA